MAYPDKIIKHNKYNSTSGEYDFCLLHYAAGTLTTPGIGSGTNNDNEPACVQAVDDTTDYSTDHNCFVAGFGETRYGDSASNAAFLQEMKVNVVDNTQCDPVDPATDTTDAAGTDANAGDDQAATTDDTQAAEDTATTLDTVCVQARNGTEGALNHNVGACKGDTGGPLVCVSAADTERKPILVGIVGPDYGCASPNEFAKYGSVNFVRQWIQDVISNDDTSTLNDNGEGYAPGGEPVGWNQADALHAKQTADISMASCTDGTTMSFVGYEGSIKLRETGGTAADENAVPPIEAELGEYNPNLQCTWTVRVPVGQVVQVSLYL